MNAIELSDRKRLIHSSLVSLGFWFVIAMIVILAPVTKNVVVEEKYPVVAINLTALPPAPPVRSVVAETAPVVPAVSSVPAAAPAAAKAAVPAAKAVTPKATAAKAATAKAAPAKVSPVKPTEKTGAVAGLGIPNFSTPIASTTGTTDASESLDFSSTTESSHPATVSRPRGGTPAAELEGAAATISKDTGTKKVSGSGSAKTGGSGAVSSETASTLAQIAGSAKSGTSNGSMSGNANGKATGSGLAGSSGTGSSVTGLSFDGTQRTLLYPLNPSIALPVSLRKLIDSDRTVTVSFSVKADGSVPGGLIVFTPTAILPAEILDYLRKEFSSWRFEKGGEDGQAKFLYSIKEE